MMQFDREAFAKQLQQGAQDLQLTLSDVQIGQLLDYLALLAKWNAVYNLTAVRDPQQMLTQHVLDCLAALPAFSEAINVLDVGAGGGLPGMVLGIWGAARAPALQVSMIDTVHKKTAFLTQAKSQLGLASVTVHTGRVEQLQVARKFDVITSRAFAELKDFITWSQHLLADGGCYIAMKGVAPLEEIGRLPAGWDVREVRALRVPGLDAQRHLVFIERAAMPLEAGQGSTTDSPA
ncbi:16S rRNA (guanine(527)-N(7))-methyltransferase RsmG [Janthinobacterium sp. 17J80-10]|uniref:16S rRNA (guanine(527)-N(7))-methyltransferase RsmG n=1 Tax=Janthinobacterium sp. 17J80-10 TaxID=2497863 RepID=UPI0010059E22|nr:16S rRNA (guanine(527)-N(7))-methyltransferase RsmG [Janthinobacterium sp. 17J80-10]QAU32880.1 16S rRNA (guanine(527)-N(7))-methyltransferase RsmG [Janthinobacterium sp. 17J80-10]